MLDHMTNFCRDDEGATAIEYSLIAALVAAAAFGAMIAMANSINQLYNVVSGEVTNSISP